MPPANRAAFLIRYSLCDKEKRTMGNLPSRDDAWKLLCEYTQNENLRKHALAVESCVRAYARKTGADEELWGRAALRSEERRVGKECRSGWWGDRGGR